MNINEQPNLLDHYAAAALQALIQKTPLLVDEIESPEDYCKEHLGKIRKSLSRSAFALALNMIENRDEFLGRAAMN